MADYTPIRKPGADLPIVTSAAVTAGQLVFVSGEQTVAPTSAATAAWIGVAAFDAALGAKVTVHAGGVHELKSTGAIVAGANVVAAAGGSVATVGSATIDQVVGVALGAAAGGKVVVKLR